MGKHTERTGRLFMAIWLGVFSLVFSYFGFIWVRWSLQELAAEHNIRLAAVWFCVSCVLLWLAFQGLMIVINLLRGRTSPRLAKRDFRNNLSNILMGAKTGMWKE